VPFIRIQNLLNFFIDKQELVYISAQDNERLRNSELKAGDLVLSKVGNTIGVVSIVTEDIGNCNISENNIGIRFPPEIQAPLKSYVLTYLNSKLGRQQILRRISGNAQPKLNVRDISEMLINVPSEDLLTNVDDLIRNSKAQVDLATSCYCQAENLLFEELGLKDFHPKYELSYTASLSKAFGVHRVDAEYFQPAYKQMTNHLATKVEVKPLKYLLLDIKKGIEVGGEQYQEEGKPFIRVSSLSVHGLVDRDQKYVSEKLYGDLSKDFEPKVGELLLTKDATPGVAYVLKEPVEGIISSGTLRLIIDETAIDKEYVALCINSVIGKLQIERDGGGSVITHWKPEQIRRLSIPVLSGETQKRIASLVQQSHEARRKARDLLEEAKRKVEEAIEAASA
jgi:restriction endonuclease S subunit